MKELIIIGGPDGAGKTTAAMDLLPSGLRIGEFVNADEIARGLSPFNPDGVAVTAGRIMLKRIETLVAAGESFAFETTCASRSHTNTLRECRAAGYLLTLLFLWLPSPESALARVARRVSEGGHDIPDDVVRRRYVAGIRNMRSIYLPLVDIALVYDNADDAGVLIAERRPATSFMIHDADRWRRIEQTGR